MKGKLLTFEGCEGCGKSTQVRLLKEYLEQSGQDFLIAREPGGTAISESIRNIILSTESASMTDECEALLYAASRAQLLKETVIPALNDGKLVILDRFIDSSFAYQGYARGLGYDFVAKANAFTLENCMPDLTVFMDVDPERAFTRKGGVDETDRLELAGLEFHKKVYSGYKAVIAKFPDRFAVFEACGTKYETHDLIVDYLKGKGFIQ